MRLIQSFHNHNLLFQTKRILYRILILFVLVFTVGCSDKSSTMPTELSECNGDLSVSVGSGTTPEFTWEPACKLAFLIVEENGADMWLIGSDGNTIAPGAVYGVAPAGVTTFRGPEPLVVGTTYNVAVRWRIGPGDDFEDFSSAYVQTFKP